MRQADEARQAAAQSREAAMPVLPRLVEPPFTLKDKSTLLVRHFKVQDADIGSEAEIRDILAPYENRKLTLAQIYEAADRITTLYRDEGYLLAKAYVSAQNATGGGVSVSSDRSARFTAAISLPQRIIHGSSSFSAAARCI